MAGVPAGEALHCFQALAHTLSIPSAQWRVLEEAHRKRNYVEYEGIVDVDAEFVEAVLRVVREVSKRVRDLASVAGS